VASAVIVVVGGLCALGMIFIGPAGCAKSAIAKACGNETKRPTICLDFSGLKGSYVGESEGNLRSALKVIDAVGQNSSLFIATCNSIGVLPPELRRRFNLGIFFFSDSIRFSISFLKAFPCPAGRLSIWGMSGFLKLLT
jgi:AAA+ superfamily predicted ATPase